MGIERVAENDGEGRAALAEAMAGVHELTVEGAGMNEAPPAGQEERIARIKAIAADLAEFPKHRDELLAEIYVTAASHEETLREIAETMAALLADPKRLVGAFFGRGKRRRGIEQVPGDGGEEKSEG